LDKNAEFDVCTIDDEGITCYECKYLNKKVDATIIHHEKGQPRALGADFKKIGFFSRKGFSEDAIVEGDVLISLEEMYDQ